MAKINILPAQVYNRIAAGEVIERPYSVVKELVENAIDAGATEIEIYVENGGTQLIRVVDNGSGIEREDLQSAFAPHATSKIKKAEDLENVLTLGFRGEAVASIASVSKMTIISKCENAKCYSLTSDGGKLGLITEAAGEKGTDVRVEALFFNAPVRLKFLKSEKGEEAEITNFVSRFILNRADIAFSYYVNGKKVLQSFGGGDEEAFVCVYGAAALRQCFKIDAEKHGIRIRGYIGNQNFSKPNKSYQSLFLNGRYIVNTTLSAAITNAYSSYLMKRQYPFYVLHIDLPGEAVDVNVHPNKADVRFANNQIVYGCVYSVISAILDGHTKALDYLVQEEKPAEEPTQKPVEKPVEKKKETKKQEEIFPQEEKKFGFATFTYEQALKELEQTSPAFAARKKDGDVPFKEVVKGYFPASSLEKPSKEKSGAEKLHEQFPDLYFKKSAFAVEAPKEEKQESEDVFAENKRFLEEFDKKKKQNRIDIRTCRYAGKLFNTYLLYEREDEVFVIDQHAAHERLVYNRLKEKMENRKIVKQPMLVPYTIELNAFESEFIREQYDEIRAMGFDIDEPEEKHFRVSAVPTDLLGLDLYVFFNDILGQVSSFRSIKLEELLKDKLALSACKAAVKGGMDLTRQEIDALFEMMDGDMGMKCPHGRPVVVKLSRVELEKMFKRIV